jgi:uncharacterized protein involved in exopolysaccharide biosynthesis
MRGFSPACIGTTGLMFMPSNEASAEELLRVVRLRWKMLLVLVLAPTLAAVVLAVVSPRRYEAEVVALPRGSQDRSGLLNSLGGSLGGLAAIAGLNIGDGAQRAEAVQMLQSRILARNFIHDNNLLPELFAADWDKGRQRWRKRPHTMNDAVQYFDRRIRSVIEDRRTGLVSVRITWRDPVQAAAWANELIRRANAELRRRAVMRAQGSIDYLKREARNADTVEIQQTLYRLMEDQYKTLLLANVSDDYAFSIIDPAVAADPEQYVSPRMSLYVAAGLFLGLLLSAVAALVAAPRLSARAAQGSTS